MNVAYGKTAEQTGIWHDYSFDYRREDHLPSVAVDGLIVVHDLGYYNVEYGAATTVYKEDPWWKVDLGAVYRIDEIKIYNARKSDRTLLILISEEPFDDDEDPWETANKDGVSHREIDDFYEGTHSIPISPPIYGRYVKLVLPWQGGHQHQWDYLKLREVAVFSEYPNLSQGKANEKFLFFGNPTWKVDLGRVYDIKGVKLLDDAGGDDVEVYVYNSSYSYIGGGFISADGDYIWDDPIQGRYVYLLRYGVEYPPEAAVFASADFIGSSNVEFHVFDGYEHGQITDACVVPCRSPEFKDADGSVIEDIDYDILDKLDADLCIADWYWAERRDEVSLEAWLEPWEFTMDGTASLFGVLPLVEAGLSANQHGGEVWIRPTEWANYLLGVTYHGHIASWCRVEYDPDDATKKTCTDFAFTGRLGKTINVSLAPDFPFLPSNKMKFSVDAEFGRFAPWSQQLWGAKAYVTFDIPGSIDWIPGVPDTIRFGAFVGISNSGFHFDVTGISAYQLVTRERVQQALAAREALAARRISGDTGDRFLPLNIDPSLHFPVPVGPPTGPAYPSGDSDGPLSVPALQDVVADVYVAHNTNASGILQTTNEAITMSVTAPDGTVYAGRGAAGEGVRITSFTRPSILPTPNQRAAQGMAGLRAVHGVDGIAALDLWANDGGGDVLLFAGLVFTDTTDYAALPPGNYTLTFREAGTSNVVAQTNATLAAGEDVTLVTVGAPGNVYAWLIADDNRGRGDLFAYQRLVHAAPNAPRLKVGPILGTLVFVDQGYGMISDYEMQLPQSRRLVFKNQATGEVLLTSGEIELEPSSTHTLFLFENAAGDLIAKGVQDAGPVGAVRLVHATSSTGDVDLVVDGETLFGAVSPATVTDDWPLDVGTHAVGVFAAGTLNPVVTTTLELTPGVDYALALVDDGGPALRVITETNTGVDATQTNAVRVAHLAPGTGAVDVTVPDHAPLATDLAYGAVGDYVAIASEHHTATVKTAGTDTTLLTAPDLPLDQGAMTLYLVEDGGLALLTGVDTRVEIERTDMLELTDAQTGTWQVTLHNAASSAEDYRFEMTGAMPETALSDVELTTDDDEATITWAVDGFEPQTTVELSLAQLAFTPEMTPTSSTVTTTQEIILPSGLTETVEVAQTSSNKLTEKVFHTLVRLNATDDPSLIAGTPQTYTFSLAALPTGIYRAKVSVDDLAHPPIHGAAETLLVVDQPWPESWAGNLGIADERYRQATLAWDHMPNPDLTRYQLTVETAGVTPSALELTPYSNVYTLTNLSPGVAYTVTLQAYNYQTEQYSLGGQVVVVGAPAEFELTQMTALPALAIDSAVSVVVSVTTDLDPYPTVVMLEPGDFSPGLGLRVTPDVVTPTLQGVTATVTISASQFMFSGAYTARLRARGGGAEHTLDFAPAVVAPFFDVTPSATALNLTPAGASLTLDATGHNGHDAEIQFDVMGVPLGVQAQLDDDVISAGETTTLRLMSTSLAQRGTYTLTLRADDGPNRQLVDVVVTVVMPDFAVTTPQAWQSINATQTAVFTLNVALLDGWAAPVTLRVDPASAPNGASLGLRANGARLRVQTTDPPATSVTLDSDGVATLVVTTTEATPLGVYLLPVTAESAGETHLVELELLVDLGTLSIWQIAGPGRYVFGSTGAEIEVVDTGGCLDTIIVRHVPESHLRAIPGLDTGQYWIIEQASCATDGSNPAQAQSVAPATFLANLTLAHPGVPDANDRVCRYDRTSGEWDCTVHSFDIGAATVTRNDVTRFSDWAVQVCDVVGDDLSVAFASAEPGNSVIISATVTNDGGVQVPAGASVSFYLGDPNAGGTLIGTTATAQALDPGASEEVGITWEGSTAGDHDIHVVVGQAGGGGGSQVWCGAPPTAQQTVSILDVPLVDGWNLISSHVNPFNTDTSVVQRPIEGQYVLIQGFDIAAGGAQSYYSDLPPEVNTLREVDGEHGYWVKVTSDQLSVISDQSADSATQEAVATLQIVGERFVEDRALELDAAWNLVSYLPRQEMALTDALGDIAGQYSIVLGYEGGALSYYSDLDPSFNTLRTMKPLFGYWIKMGQAGTLHYPTTGGDQILDIGYSQPSIPNTQYPISNIRAAERAAGVTPTHTWVNFYGTAQAWDGAQLPVGVTVEAMDEDGVVCGAAVIHTEGQYGLLACYGDDPTTAEDEGAQPGDTIRLVVGDEVLAKGTWTAHGDRQWRPLGKPYTQQVYLPLIRKGD